MRSKLLRKSLGMSAAALLLLGNSAWAEQVLKYSVRWDVYTDRYRVYMRPTKTPSPDQTLTSQLTIRVPHFTGASRFSVSDLRTAVTNTTWSGDADESRVDAPTENPTKDYISFELSVKGSDRGLYAWKAGKEQEVFSFTFGTAGCKGLVEIMPDNDPFDPKNIASGYNSSSTNPGNQFTNLGWGTMLDNNYLGVEGTAADCTQSFDTDGDGLKDGIEKIVGTDPNNPDTDGDGKKDGVEVGTGTTPLDTDGDGKIDALESVITDTDKDGVVDELDPDNANACIPSAKAATCDQDGDGTPNASDTDDDGDGVADTTETALGTDPNDADSDNVNTSTVNEGTTGTQTGKSASDDSVTDTDGDGKTDAAECLPLNGTKCKDTDGDGKYDWQESALTDTDKDGVVDELDPDNANACIPSAKAATCDQDGDGTPNASDTDDDGDGVADTTETALGTDPNDADSDNVNTSTVNEGTTGTQTGKSASDDSVTDTDGDGKTDAAECLPLNGTKCKDTDGDGKYDWQESALTDTDKDGVVDELDPDNANACIPSAKAATCDQDGDGTPNSSDTDDDGDGVADTTETALGTDPNDADSDNVNTSTVNEGTSGTQTGKSASDDSVTDTDGDGKTDAAECLPLNGTKCKDTDGDGKYDWQESALTDTDKDGVVDELDPDNANACIPSAKAATCDQDGDGTPNASDTDDDGDGVADTTETALGTDPNDADSDNVNTSTVNEGTTGTQTGKSASDDSVTDTDGDGKTDAAECLPLNGTKCKDTDGDGKYDWQESALNDADGDGIKDELDPDDATPQNIKVQVKALLQGPFDSSTLMMVDTLRSKGLIPTTQPYNNDSFLYKGTETIKASLLTTTGTDAPVDWVLVELRNATTPANTVARKAALLQRDGDVMDAATGDVTLSFDGVTQGNYYVVVRHRNHLGVMTAAAMALSANATKVDFSKPSTPTWGTNARLNLDTNGDAVDDTAFLWSGNADMNSVVIASGPSNDTSSVLYNVWQAPGNTSGSINYILPGYLTTDFNLDGNTVYSGRGNDINVLLANVLLHPGNTTLSSNYIIRQQLP